MPCINKPSTGVLINPWYFWLNCVLNLFKSTHKNIFLQCALGVQRQTGKNKKVTVGMQGFLFVGPSIKSQPCWSPFSKNAERTLKWQTVGEWSVWLTWEFANSPTLWPLVLLRETEKEILTILREMERGFKLAREWRTLLCDMMALIFSSMIPRPWIISYCR